VFEISAFNKRSGGTRTLSIPPSASSIVPGSARPIKVRTCPTRLRPRFWERCIVAERYSEGRRVSGFLAYAEADHPRNGGHSLAPGHVDRRCFEPFAHTSFTSHVSNREPGLPARLGRLSLRNDAPGTGSFHQDHRCLVSVLQEYSLSIGPRGERAKLTTAVEAVRTGETDLELGAN
jgi:hypothetical protein